MIDLVVGKGLVGVSQGRGEGDGYITSKCLERSWLRKEPKPSVTPYVFVLAGGMMGIVFALG